MDHRGMPDSTIASNILSGINAAYIEGIDLKSFRPHLDRLLRKIAARRRKIGSESRRSKKNTEEDPRLPFDVPQFQSSLKKLLDSPDASSFKTQMTIASVVLALSAGMRVSDVRAIPSDSVSIEPNRIVVRVPNVKCSSPDSKHLFQKDPVPGSRGFRYRRIVYPKNQRRYSVYTVLKRFMESFPPTRSFLFSAFPWSTSPIAPKTLSERWATVLESLPSRSDHIFRVANVSLARAAGIPDSEIMLRNDWGEEGLLDRYQRVVRSGLSWSILKNYDLCLGL